jgi:hypothetical protein
MGSGDLEDIFGGRPRLTLVVSADARRSKVFGATRNVGGSLPVPLMPALDELDGDGGWSDFFLWRGSMAFFKLEKVMSKEKKGGHFVCA